MRRMCLFICVATISCVTTVLAAPRLRCRDAKFDFGAADNSGSVEHTFTLWNDGDQPLKITRIRGCCGATTKLASKEIAPGTNTTLAITLSLKGRNGKQRKNFYVSSNDPKQPHLQLRFVGTATTVVDVQPRHMSFGQVAAGAVSERTATITSKSGFEFGITNVAVDVEFFSITHKRVNEQVHELTVRTVPPLPVGVTRGIVKLLTDDPKRKEVRLDVIATVASDIVVVPSEIVLPTREKKSQALVKRVVLKSRSKTPFRIIKITCPEEDIKTEYKRLGPYSYKCTFRNLMSFPDLNTKKIVIEVEHDTVSRIEIPICVGKKSCCH